MSAEYSEDWQIPRKDDLQFHTGVALGQLTRYCNAVYSEELLDLLDIISTINDDLYNSREQSLIVESVTRAKEVLDKIAVKKWDD